ncbi:MAG: hypothetical protein KJO12_10215, partial [Ignavibacteria bacterium]|nr:hypothetical protein [Ignavibacteria bacterium]
MAQKTLPEQLLSELRRFNEDPSVLEGYSTTRLKELYRTINKFNIEQQKTIAIRGTSLNTFRKNIVFELQVRGEVPTVDAKRKVVTKLEKTRRNAAKVAKNIHESNRKALIYGISGATDGLIGTETLDRVTKIQKNIVDSTIDSIFARPRNVPKAIKVG